MLGFALGLTLVLAVAACDAAPAPQPAVSPAVPTQQPDLPAVEPAAPTVAEFREAAVEACAQAQQQIAAVPLRGDPLHPKARRRDVRAAVEHYAATAHAWTTAANTLFDFGLPEDPSGQDFIGALDSLALRAQQAAEALGGADAAAAQSAVAFADDARSATDRVARDLGVGPLDSCGESSTAQFQRRHLIVASDFRFRLSPPTRGRTRIVLRNAGDEEHHLFVVRLREAGTLQEAVLADRNGGNPGSYLAGEGTVSAAIGPGERTAINVRFRPGPYGLLCFVASPDGTPHAYKGMATEVLIQD